jgi:hypothetical protein
MLRNNQTILQTCPSCLRCPCLWSCCMRTQAIRAAWPWIHWKVNQNQIIGAKNGPIERSRSVGADGPHSGNVVLYCHNASNATAATSRVFTRRLGRMEDQTQPVSEAVTACPRLLNLSKIASQTQALQHIRNSKINLTGPYSLLASRPKECTALETYSVLQH